MEACRDRFTAAELLSYKEALYDEDTEEWYAPYDPKEVESEERNCMRLARQFYHLVKEYRERFFTYVLFHSPPQSAATHLESFRSATRRGEDATRVQSTVEVCRRIGN